MKLLDTQLTAFLPTALKEMRITEWKCAQAATKCRGRMINELTVVASFVNLYLRLKNAGILGYCHCEEVEVSCLLGHANLYTKL